MNLPKTVTALYFLARYPSNQSVVPATTYTKNAASAQYRTSVQTSATAQNVSRIRKIVRVFGKFIVK